VPNPNGNEEVRVTLVYRMEENPTSVDHAVWSTWFQELGLNGELRDYPHSVSDLLFELSDMLGHKRDELDFAYPDQD